MSDKGTHSDKQGKGSNAGKAAAGVAVIAAIVAFFSINGGQNILSGGGSGSQEQDQSAVQESTVVQEDIQIQIDTTDVYVNGEKIEYTAGDTESLKKAFKKKIEELLTDNSSVYIEYENGDYNTYQAVQQVLDDMSIETIQVQEN
ncbi:MAG TPA: hypothetical protein DCR16_04180 [Lachnospiraceae bacterium]|jgi:hypothetical protein|nr:hypothetical protein [Lachnospiraceae bacterium]